MKTNRMPCKRAKTQIALLVGQDLEETAQYEVERHLAECPDCRGYRVELGRTFEVFERMGTVVSADPEPSLWPDVAQRISRIQKTRPSVQRTNWTPLVAIAAACLFVAFLASYEPSNDYNDVLRPVRVVPTAPAYSQPFYEAPAPRSQDPFMVAEPSEFLLLRGGNGSADFGRNSEQKKRRHVPIVPVNQWNANGF